MKLRAWGRAFAGVARRSQNVCLTVTVASISSAMNNRELAVLRKLPDQKRDLMQDLLAGKVPVQVDIESMGPAVG